MTGSLRAAFARARQTRNSIVRDEQRLADSRARHAVAVHVLVDRYGMSPGDLAGYLEVTRSRIHQLAAQGRALSGSESGLSATESPDPPGPD